MKSNLSSLLEKQPAPPHAQTHKRDWRERAASWLPFLLIAGFVVCAVLLFGERLLPARAVAVASVVALPSAASADAPASAAPSASVGTPAPSFDADMLFQASGWIEAGPYPIRAAAMVSGFVQQVFVFEGDTVRAGDVLVELDPADAALALERTRANLREREAELAGARAAANVARARLRQHAHDVAAGESRLAELRDEADRLRAAGATAFSLRDIEQARLRVATQQANVLALEARRAELESMLALQEAEIERALGRAADARAQLAESELALERTRVRSPVGGVIQRMAVAPGQKTIVAADDPESATVALIFQPERLQARIDVPLDKAASVAIGQPVRLRTNFLRDTVLRGTVARIGGEADLQRNTLEVKVTLIDADPRLRPDMLCRAEFLPAPRAISSGAPPGPSASGTHTVMLFAPRAALVAQSGSEAQVWVVDHSGERIARRAVRLGGAVREAHVEIVDGLRPGERVVVNPPADLREGQRVRSSLQ